MTNNRAPSLSAGETRLSSAYRMMATFGRPALLALATLTAACGSQQAETDAEFALSAGNESTGTTTGGQPSGTAGGGTESGTTGAGSDSESSDSTVTDTTGVTGSATTGGVGTDTIGDTDPTSGTTAGTDTNGSTTTGDVDTDTGDTDSTSTTGPDPCNETCLNVTAKAGGFYNPDYYDEGEEPCADSEGQLTWEQMTMVVDKIMGSPCDPNKFKVDLHDGKLDDATLALMTPEGARVAECFEFLGAIKNVPVDFQETGLCPFEVDAVLNPLKDPGSNQSTSFPKTEFSIDADKYQSVTTVDLSVRDPQGDYIDGFRVTPFADKDIENCHVSIVASPPKGDSFLLYKGENNALVNNELNTFNFPPQSLTAFDTTVSLECILDKPNTFIFVSPRTLFNEEASPEEQSYNLYLPSYSTVVEAP